MIELNQEQRDAVFLDGNAVVTACPGSGKTRVLTARVMRAIEKFTSRHEKVVALTYTNRAADEIQARLDEENVDAGPLWAGTIHRFVLEWILRPYAPYCPEIRFGFKLVNEYAAEQLLRKLRTEAGLRIFDSVSTAINRNGENLNSSPQKKAVFEAYKAELRRQGLIDFDDVLYFGYRLLGERPEIAENLASIFRVICVDEAQDIQDLQYGILARIYSAATCKPVIFLVGDEDQSIYESLGATTKSPTQIAEEFGIVGILHKTLHGNYRSTQRIIDFYRLLRPAVPYIQARSNWASEDGLITFDNQTIWKEKLAEEIAARITAAIHDGVPTNDICVIAPRWIHIKPLARQLVNVLPEVDFDAPGLSPLHGSYENLWFKIARLVLTSPSPLRTRTRSRWAKEALGELREITDSDLPENINSSRRLLRLLNSLSSEDDDGLEYLRDIFRQFLRSIALDVETCIALKQAYEGFFKRAEDHLSSTDETLPRDTESFRRLFSHPSGVVINTCHGVKGEEYDTVIAFGLLRGFIPHWDAIIDQPKSVGDEQESKLLYVICSRAKRRLHLIAEAGRQTTRNNPYYTADLLRNTSWTYD